MIKFINLVLLIIFIALVLIFTTQNHELVSVKFLELRSINLPISVIVFSAVIAGIFIGLIYHFYAVYKIRKELKTNNEKEKL